MVTELEARRAAMRQGIAAARASLRAMQEDDAGLGLVWSGLDLPRAAKEALAELEDQDRRDSENESGAASAGPSPQGARPEAGSSERTEEGEEDADDDDEDIIDPDEAGEQEVPQEAEAQRAAMQARLCAQGTARATRRIIRSRSEGMSRRRFRLASEHSGSLMDADVSEGLSASSAAHSSADGPKPSRTRLQRRTSWEAGTLEAELLKELSKHRQKTAEMLAQHDLLREVVAACRAEVSEAQDLGEGQEEGRGSTQAREAGVRDEEERSAAPPGTEPTRTTEESTESGSEVSAGYGESESAPPRAVGLEASGKGAARAALTPPRAKEKRNLRQRTEALDTSLGDILDNIEGLRRELGALRVQYSVAEAERDEASRRAETLTRSQNVALDHIGALQDELRVVQAESRYAQHRAAMLQRSHSIAVDHIGELQERLRTLQVQRDVALEILDEQPGLQREAARLRGIRAVRDNIEERADGDAGPAAAAGAGSSQPRPALQVTDEDFTFFF